MVETKPLVLAVDDEVDICRLMQRILGSAGYEVIMATDGSQALEMVDRRKPDLVLLDIKMLGKSGLEVFQALRANHPDTGVIMATAVADVSVAIDTLRDGALDYLVKPFNVSELVVSVAGALERRRLILENRDYRLNLERKVAEQTQLLEQKVRQLTALNNLCVTYLNQGFEAAETYIRLSSDVIRMAEAIQTLAQEAAVRQLAGDIIKTTREIQALASEAEARRVEVQVPPEEKEPTNR